MKWYKHDSNASQDAKMKKLRLKYGMEGYGVYWYCLELIAKNVEKHNLTFELEEDAELISADTGIYQETIQEMMAFMVNLGLFEQVDNKITCLKMSTRTDEYTQKLIKTSRVVPIVSRQTPDSVPIMSDLIEENRREENILDTSKPIDINKPSKDKAKRFVKPELTEITNYFLANQSTEAEAKRFELFYESNGWKVGKNKMQKWKASAAGWISRNPNKTQSTGTEFYG